MRSDEFPKGTLKHNNYVDCTKKVSILTNTKLETKVNSVLKQCFTASGVKERFLVHVKRSSFVFLGDVFIQKLNLQKHIK